MELFRDFGRTAYPNEAGPEVRAALTNMVESARRARRALPSVPR